MLKLDRIAGYLACIGVLLAPVFTYAFLNVVTRPEMITVAIELPKPKPVIAIYEYGPDEEMLPLDGFWYNDDEPYEQYIAKDEPPKKIATEDNILCMAKNIYFESRTQSLEGQLAVGLVTLNRVNSSRFPNSVCGVVYQHLQFSWYWDGRSDNPKYQDQWQAALLLASALLSKEGTITDFTYGSDHYHADYVEPEWRLAMVKVTQIQQHIFYRYDNRIY